MNEATVLWRRANPGNDDVWPDRGELLTWLLWEIHGAKVALWEEKDENWDQWKRENPGISYREWMNRTMVDNLTQLFEEVLENQRRNPASESEESGVC